jgi:hypothetical protein
MNRIKFYYSDIKDALSCVSTEKIALFAVVKSFIHTTLSHVGTTTAQTKRSEIRFFSVEKYLV